jgi:hypothetical protein
MWNVQSRVVRDINSSIVSKNIMLQLQVGVV